MAARSRLCSERDDFAASATAGAALPFLPTLAFAAILSLGAVCWETAAPVPEAPDAAVSEMKASVPVPRMARAETEEAAPKVQASAVEASPRPPASIAFAVQFPLSAEVVTLAKASTTRPLHRIARTPSCIGPRCAEAAQTASAALRRPHPAAPPHSAQPFAPPRDLERLEASAADRTTPEAALPFAPTFRVVRETVGRTIGILGSQAAILRGEAVALSGLVDGLR